MSSELSILFIKTEFLTDLELAQSDGCPASEPRESTCLYLTSAKITSTPQVALFVVAFYLLAREGISAPLACDFSLLTASYSSTLWESETMAVMQRATSEAPHQLFCLHLSTTCKLQDFFPLP